MKKNFTILFLLFLTTIALHAQKKSELIIEIRILETKIDSSMALVAEARKNEKGSLAKADALGNQIKELQDANSTLLKNLNNFAKVSNKNSENINMALASLEAKENQFKDINDALASHDSIALVVFTNARDSITEASITVGDGSVIISASLNALFGDDSSQVLTETSFVLLEKIAALLTNHPGSALTIEGLSMTGELDLAAQKAMATSNYLQNQLKIESNRINVLGKDGGFKEGISFKIHPNYNAFYSLVKESMKAVNKN